MICPKCSSKDIAKIVYGLVKIEGELEKELDQNKIILGGCCVSGNDPQFSCNNCNHRWGNSENNTDSFDFEQGFNLDEVYD